MYTLSPEVCPSSMLPGICDVHAVYCDVLAGYRVKRRGKGLLNSSIGGGWSLYLGINQRHANDLAHSEKRESLLKHLLS